MVKTALACESQLQVERPMVTYARYDGAAERWPGVGQWSASESSSLRRLRLLSLPDRGLENVCLFECMQRSL